MIESSTKLQIAISIVYQAVTLYCTLKVRLSSTKSSTKFD